MEHCHSIMYRDLLASRETVFSTVFRLYRLCGLIFLIVGQIGNLSRLDVVFLKRHEGIEAVFPAFFFCGTMARSLR